MTGGVLLAAGEGRRFAGQTHKLLADLGGRPLVSYALDAMVEAGFDRVVIITGAVELTAVIPPSVTELVNPAWAEGQATSLSLATRWAADGGLRAIVVGLGDQPGIPPSAWRAVAAADLTPIAIATYTGRRGHPVRLASEVWDRLPQVGDRGAAALIGGSPELVTEVACDGDPDDVDTVEDLTKRAMTDRSGGDDR